MSAVTILPHQLAASILFLYAALAVVFTTRRKPPQPVPPPLTYRDVDLVFCTDEELDYMLGVILVQPAPLTHGEITLFWSILEELNLRGALNG
jgi:hypothetical protein